MPISSLCRNGAVALFLLTLSGLSFCGEAVAPCAKTLDNFVTTVTSDPVTMALADRYSIRLFAELRRRYLEWDEQRALHIIQGEVKKAFVETLRNYAEENWTEKELAALTVSLKPVAGVEKQHMALVLEPRLATATYYSISTIQTKLDESKN